MGEHTLTPTTLDCSNLSTRDINQKLKALLAAGINDITVLHPDGRHNLGVGLATAATIRFQGAVGYYCGGLCDGINYEINGSCGWSLGENLMSGQIVVHGNASAMAAASAQGGTVCILGHAGARAGISLKGGTLMVTGNVGQSSAFMMQAGRLIVCGNAAANLGDSMYSGEIFVGGTITSLGADARLEPMGDRDWQTLTTQLQPWNITATDYDFKKVVCAKQLYHFQAKNFSRFRDVY